MKVFISWSGERSRAVAEALRDWIPNVIQVIEPWVSASDISAGARWTRAVEMELEATEFGILCVTPENATAPWLHFEAGALAKRVVESVVCPYLIGMNPADLPGGPLTLFQAKTADKLGTWSLIVALNRAAQERGLSDAQLERTFELWWPHLEEVLQPILESREITHQPRPLPAMVEEILETVRDLARAEHIRVAGEFFGLRSDLQQEGQPQSKREILRGLANEAESAVQQLTEKEPREIYAVRVVAVESGFSVLIKAVDGIQAMTHASFDPFEVPDERRLSAAIAAVLNAIEGIMVEIEDDRRHYATEEGRKALEGSLDETNTGNGA